MEISLCVCGQSIPLPPSLPQGHPRLLTNNEQKSIIQKQVSAEPWAKEALDGIKGRIESLNYLLD